MGNGIQTAIDHTIREICEVYRSATGGVARPEECVPAVEHLEGMGGAFGLPAPASTSEAIREQLISGALSVVPDKLENCLAAVRALPRPPVRTSYEKVGYVAATQFIGGTWSYSARDWPGLVVARELIGLEQLEPACRGAIVPEFEVHDVAAPPED